MSEKIAGQIHDDFIGDARKIIVPTAESFTTEPDRCSPLHFSAIISNQIVSFAMGGNGGGAKTTRSAPVRMYI